MLTFILYMSAISVMALSLTDYIWNNDWENHPLHTCISATAFVISIMYVICQTCAYAL